MAFTALLIGAVLIIVGLLRLGWISEFLSTPVITGVLAGIAVQIAVRQLPAILGIRGGGTTLIGRLRVVADQFPHTNLWSLAIALGVLVIVVLAHRVNRRLPGALVGLILSILAVDAFGLASHHGVAILGPVHGGVPHLHAPAITLAELRKLPGVVLTAAFVCIAQTAATVRASSVGTSSVSNFDRDLIGVGAGSVASGLVGSIAVDASPPNTAIVTASGAHSQLSNIVAAGVVVIVIFSLTGPLEHLPEATLGATLLFVATRLFRLGELGKIARFDRLELTLALVTLVVVAVVGIEQGVALAMVLSLADRTHRSARPRDAILGREPGTDHWIPLDIGLPTEQVPGILVYLGYAPLWYGDADYLLLRVLDIIETSADPITAIVLDADGMSDIDYTGLQALRGLIAQLEKRGVTLGIARASHLVHHDLKHGALIDEVGADHLFTSVEEAVIALVR
jgi:MFS superfamily sulfate permease-like transporter